MANADATALYRDLLPRPRLLPRGEPSLSGLVLLLGLRGGRDPGPRGHHTVLFPADYDDEFDSVFSGRMPQDPTIYVSAPADPRSRRRGARRGSSWSTRRATAAGAKEFDWDAPGATERAADAVLAGSPAAASTSPTASSVRRVLTPGRPRAPHRDARRVDLRHLGQRRTAAFLRPANRSPVPGLFLVGGSAHPGGGLPLVALSGAAVARLVGPA